MAATVRAGSAVVTGGTTSTAAVTAVPTLPTGTATGDRVFVVGVGTAAVTLSANSSGWTTLRSSTSLGGGSAGASTGPRFVGIWWRDKDAGWSTMPTVQSASMTANSVAAYAVTVQKGASEVFDAPINAGTGTMTTGSTSMSISLTTNVYDTGDLVILNDAFPSTTTTSSGNITATGVTFGTKTNTVTSAGTTTGNDVAAACWTCPVTTGSGTSRSATHTATLGTARTAGCALVLQSVHVDYTAAPADVADAVDDVVLDREAAFTDGTAAIDDAVTDYTPGGTDYTGTPGDAGAAADSVAATQALDRRPTDTAAVTDGVVVSIVGIALTATPVDAAGATDATDVRQALDRRPTADAAAAADGTVLAVGRAPADGAGASDVAAVAQAQALAPADGAAVGDSFFVGQTRTASDAAGAADAAPALVQAMDRAPSDGAAAADKASADHGFPMSDGAGAGDTVAVGQAIDRRVTDTAAAADSAVVAQSGSGSQDMTDAAGTGDAVVVVQAQAVNPTDGSLAADGVALGRGLPVADVAAASDVVVTALHLERQIVDTAVFTDAAIGRVTQSSDQAPTDGAGAGDTVLAELGLVRGAADEAGAGDSVSWTMEMFVEVADGAGAADAMTAGAQDAAVVTDGAGATDSVEWAITSGRNVVVRVAGWGARRVTAEGSRQPVNNHNRARTTLSSARIPSVGGSTRARTVRGQAKEN